MRFTTGVLFSLIVMGGATPAAATELVVPRYKASQILLRPSDHAEMNYYLTPNLVRISDREILITIKRGSSHGWEDTADAEMIRFDTVKNTIVEQRTIGHVPGRKFQLTMGTLLGDGSLAMYTDFQHTGDDGRHYRNGMRYTRSADRGATFGPWEEFGLVDGVEYGYPFDFIVEGQTVYLLTMSFGYRPGGRWSVAVLRSNDHGRTWSFVRDLTKEFGGFRINESGFMRHGDGFLVATRGYDNAVRLQQTDGQFRMRKQVNLTQTCPYVKDYIGWPRLFTRDGGSYLLGRNWVETPAKKLDKRPVNFPGIPRQSANLPASLQSGHARSGACGEPRQRERAHAGRRWLLWRALLAGTRWPRVVQYDHLSRNRSDPAGYRAFGI